MPCYATKIAGIDFDDVDQCIQKCAWIFNILETISDKEEGSVKKLESRPGKLANLERNSDKADTLLNRHYFSDDVLYDAA